jgi:hypothetical protein
MRARKLNEGIVSAMMLRKKGRDFNFSHFVPSIARLGLASRDPVLWRWNGVIDPHDHAALSYPPAAILPDRERTIVGHDWPTIQCSPPRFFFSFLPLHFISSDPSSGIIC